MQLHTPPRRKRGRPQPPAVVACAAAQVAKVFTFRQTEGRWDWSMCLSSGGMPSSHTSLVVGLATLGNALFNCFIICSHPGFQAANRGPSAADTLAAADVVVN